MFSLPSLLLLLLLLLYQLDLLFSTFRASFSSNNLSISSAYANNKVYSHGCYVIMMKLKPDEMADTPGLELCLAGDLGVPANSNDNDIFQ